MLILTLCSVLAGYGYYKMNPHDPLVAFLFGFGLLGIMLSFNRQNN